MRQAGLSGMVRRRKGRTTVSAPGIATAPDLVRRDFAPEAPNRLWVADLTEVATWEGKLYLAVVIDCYSRRCVGWAMAEHMRAELVVEALEMAIWQRRPETGLVHHSDRGGQLTAGIGVMHEFDVGSVAAARERHAQRVEHQIGAHVAGQLPTDDTSRPHVDDEREEHDALPATQVAEVRHPQPVRAAGAEVTADAVGRSHRRWVGGRGAPGRPRRLAPCTPLARISRLTRSRPTSTPARVS
jgi:hypothetical protein